MEMSILDSLNVANKLASLKEADQQQQAAQPQQQAAAPTNSNVDQAQLEKAFEAALQNVKGEIVKEVQGLMERFGSELVKKLSGSNNSGQQQQAATNTDNNNNNAQPAQEENTNGNK